MARDHPRIRGEHAPIFDISDRNLGSSPHTRGARRTGTPSRPRGRIIPAYAGSTPLTDEKGAGARIIPAYAGSTCQMPMALLPWTGSSPHTRGAPGRSTRAGCSRRDHPRIRGEHTSTWLTPEIPSGSSSHTRGAPDPPQQHRRHPRIIPAYAGSTGDRGRAGRDWRDHPRIRGEHVQMNRAIADGSGSSPHTRGALHATVRRWPSVWIIPAYAGSTDR